MGHTWQGDAGWWRGPFWVPSELCSSLCAASPKAHGSQFPCTWGSGHEDFVVAGAGWMGGIGKPKTLPEWCQVPPVGSPATPAWPMGLSTINNRTEILQHPRAASTSPLFSSQPRRSH